MEPLLTVNDAAAFLSVHPMTVYRAVETGRLNHVRVGRNIRISREALEAFISPENTRAPEPPKTVTRAPVTRL